MSGAQVYIEADTEEKFSLYVFQVGQASLPIRDDTTVSCPGNPTPRVFYTASVCVCVFDSLWMWSAECVIIMCAENLYNLSFVLSESKWAKLTH